MHTANREGAPAARVKKKTGSAKNMANVTAKSSGVNKETVDANFKSLETNYDIIAWGASCRELALAGDLQMMLHMPAVGSCMPRDRRNKLRSRLLVLPSLFVILAPRPQGLCRLLRMCCNM